MNLTDKELLHSLQTIFSSVYRRFIYVPDKVMWGKVDHWESYDELPLEGKFKGDCDGFALMCRKLCRSQDIKSRLVFCRVEDNVTFHLVCESNGYIMDNRCTRVVRIDELDYNWMYISGYNKGDTWNAVSIDKNTRSILL